MSRIDETWEPQDTADELRAWAFSGNMERAIAGKNGQKILRELEAALLALPFKRLVRGVLARRAVNLGACELQPDVCALGALALKRGLSIGQQMDVILERLASAFPEKDPEDEGYLTEWEITKKTGEMLNICHPLVFAIVEQNDREYRQSPEDRYEHVLIWVREHIKKEPAS